MNVAVIPAGANGTVADGARGNEAGLNGAGANEGAWPAISATESLIHESYERGMGAHASAAGAGFRNKWMNLLGAFGMGLQAGSAIDCEKGKTADIACSISPAIYATAPTQPVPGPSEKHAESVPMVRPRKSAQGVVPLQGRRHRHTSSTETTKKPTAASATTGVTPPSAEIETSSLGRSLGTLAAPVLHEPRQPVAIHGHDLLTQWSKADLERGSHETSGVSFDVMSCGPENATATETMKAESAYATNKAPRAPNREERNIRPAVGVGADREIPAVTPDVQERPEALRTYIDRTAAPRATTTHFGESIEAKAGTAAVPTLRPASRIGSVKSARTSESHQARGVAAERNDAGDGTIRFDGPDVRVPQPPREIGTAMRDDAQNKGSSAGVSPHALNEPGAAFARLDAARPSAPPTWIHAGTRHAEAGFLDPALGWVGVRADAIGNHVHASVVPVSAEAAQVLGSHLPGLNAFLSEQNGSSATVSMGSFESGQSGHGSSENLRDQGGAETSGREARHRGPDTAQVQATQLMPSIPVMTGGASATAGGGRYISVVA